MHLRALLALALSVLLPLSALSAAPESPNILFILTDDQGYGDFSAHGNPILKTPHLDALHAQSVRFTDFHVSPTCSPTRSALFTGRHEFKNGVTHTILERERLTLDVTTLAQVLKTAGYTTGIFGKWHLGDEPAYQPGARGFDEVFIHGGGGLGQSYPGSCGDVPGNTYFDPVIRHNGTFKKTTGFCTDVFFSQATRWIESAKKPGRPFFAYIATNAPHSPYTARPEDAALYRGKVGTGPDAESVANFFGMIHNIDENVGRLLAFLDAQDLTRDTLVIYMNDNGTAAGAKIFNAGMRAQKGTPWLGGTRAASLWRWPAHFTPGNVAGLTAHLDFFPTLAELAGASLAPAVRAQIEGRSLVSSSRKPRRLGPTARSSPTSAAGPRAAIPPSQNSKTAPCATRAGTLSRSPAAPPPRGSSSISPPIPASNATSPPTIPPRSAAWPTPTTRGGSPCSPASSTKPPSARA